MMKELQYRLGYYERKIVQSIEKLKNEQDIFEKIEILDQLWNLCNFDDLKELLTEERFGLIPLLTEILEYESIEIHRSALGCFWYLSRNVNNRIFFCREDIAIIPILMRMLRNNHEHQQMIRSILLNCSLEKVNHPYLLSDEIGYLDFLRNELITDSTSVVPYRAFCYITMAIENQLIPSLIRFQIPELIINYLILCGTNPITWTDRHAGPEYWALNFFVDLISQNEGLKAIQKLQKNYYFIELLSCKEMEGIKATCIVANLLDNHSSYSHVMKKSQDDNESYDILQNSQESSILLAYPEIFPLLMDVFVATYACDTSSHSAKLYRYGFAFGIITMRVISMTLKRLSYSKANTSLMLQHSSLLRLIVSMIELFNSNGPELRVKDSFGYSLAGGGGKDYETLDSFLECLLQFYFYYYQEIYENNLRNQFHSDCDEDDEDEDEGEGDAIDHLLVDGVLGLQSLKDIEGEKSEFTLWDAYEENETKRRRNSSISSASSAPPPPPPPATPVVATMSPPPAAPQSNSTPGGTPASTSRKKLSSRETSRSVSLTGIQISFETIHSQVETVLTDLLHLPLERNVPQKSIQIAMIILRLIPAEFRSYFTS